jgi:Zn-dependent protease with chaperone function
VRASAAFHPLDDLRPNWLVFHASFAQFHSVIGYLLLVPINFIVAGILTFCLNWLAAIPWRKASSAHWTERARLLWPVRTSGANNILLSPILLSLAEVAAGWESWQGFVIPTLAGWLGAILATYPLDHEMFPRFTFSAWRRLVTASWMIRVGFLGAVAVSAVLMPAEPGVAMAMISAGLLLYILALNYGLFIRLLRWMGAAHSPDERLREIVADTSRRMGIREPRTWLLDVPLAQAFAMPTTGDLMFSSRLLEISSDEEISAVCAHEIAHLMESKVVLAGRIAGSMTLYPFIFLRPAASRTPFGVLAISGLVFVLAILTRKLSRRMEVRADKIATENQGDEGIYARALEKIYCDGLLPAVNAGNAKTHPNLYDRMLAAGIQPDFPRPAKPRRMSWPLYLIYVAFGLLIGYALAGGGSN